MSYNLRCIEAGGCRIEYAESGSGPTMVYLHGSTGFRFDEASFGLLGKKFRLLVPTMPGFDRSTIGNVSSAVDMADVMADFIRTAGGGCAHLIGESFGGRIAAWLAIRHPELVQTLTLAAPTGTRKDDGDLRLGGTPEGMQALLFGRLPYPAPTPEQAAQVRANVANAVRLSATWDQDMVQKLPTIACPTLILRGSDDQTLSQEAVHEFARRIPGSTLSEVAGAPHVISATHPDQFAALVGDFVENQRRLLL
jgi:pimeloyl-ACP methyl ester carboxylesterase